MQIIKLHRTLKMFQLLTVIFAIAGLIISVVAISKIWNGGSWGSILRNPVDLVFLVIPLAPAVALYFVSNFHEMRLKGMISKTKKN